jgi:uncharacterized protein (DUF952 family)
VSDTNIIYHIANANQWAKSLEAGAYEGDTLKTEGFIHFSFDHQVLATANRHYHGVRGLVLLKVNTSKLSPELKYELAPIGETFPHLYGPLNLDAVEKVFDFSPDAAGNFVKLPF